VFYGGISTKFCQEKKEERKNKSGQDGEAGQKIYLINARTRMTANPKAHPAF
jgi:hypothetical protein